MADKAAKTEGCVEGPYFIDDNCIGCGTCVGIAPFCFRLNDIETKSMVFNQPQTDAEVQACEDALGSCPVSAIGNDG